MREFPTAPAPHVPARTSVRALMQRVLLALAPGLALQGWFFGPGVWLQVLLALLFALAFEAAMLRLRGQPLQPWIGDFSAPVTAVLFALCIPPLAPWWIAAIGMLVAMVFAKHLYGGLGRNLFNPAMAGYAVVLLCFPFELSQWPAPATPAGFADTLHAVAFGSLPGRIEWDAITQATPLELLRQGAAEARTLEEIRAAPGFGLLGGAGWEWIALAHLAGGLWLWRRRTIGWRVPAGVCGGIVLLALPWWLADPSVHASPLQHLLSGGLMLAAFFIATDPVTGCTTPRGQLLFGFGVAALALAIRHWGAYPDGVAFAVLLMNCAAPWIDLHTRPRIFGEVPGGRPRP